MSNCEDSLWNHRFPKNSIWNHRLSHVYIEEGILAHPGTKKILSRIRHPSIIPIAHYKDVFCRKNQEFAAQKNTPQLILAKKTDSFLYEGSSMCDNFGHANFYYTSDVMNCVYQCEYCYLQGMYPSANLVVFVNLEDTFRDIEIRLEKNPMYVCISYDTDLLGLEHLTGFVSDWIGFAAQHPDATIELRTKSANFSKIANKTPPQNFILAWSLSPEQIVESCEKHTPSLRARLQSMGYAMEKGWKVRLCVDPMIHTDQWETVYEEFFQTVREAIPVDRLHGFSIGVFRVPKDSLKTMRMIHPESSFLAYPFSLSDTGWSYPEEQKKKMTNFMEERFASVRNSPHQPESRMQID